MTLKISGDILVVEDDHVLNQLITRHLNRIGYNTHSVDRWQTAQSYLNENEPNLIIMDVRLPDADGMDLLPSLTTQQPVIVLTAYGTVQNAVLAMKEGAMEYLAKPINLDELEVVIDRSLENAALRRDHFFFKKRIDSSQDRTMVGSGVEMQEIHRLIGVVAPTEVTVLIQGESGVGKELVAQAIHDRSPRNNRNFIAVDCCTLQKELFESELFGHERGAFTNADRQKKGLIEGADGGTLFLDEIGDIEPAIQAKLLRVLETGLFRRVGGTRDIRANIRIVAATNRKLESLTQEGNFRKDLYYRLNGFTINIPPLRDRVEDIPELVEHFLSHHRLSRRVQKQISSPALHQLKSYEWPGNVRELRNVIERAIIISEDEQMMSPQHLGLGSIPAMPTGTDSTADEKETVLRFDHEPTLETIEQNYLNMLLDKYDGHRHSVAKAMGISERNIYRLIRKYKLHKSTH